MVAEGDRTALAAVVAFQGEVGKGFRPSAFGNAFEKEVRDRCIKNLRGRTAMIQELAQFLLVIPCGKRSGPGKLESRCLP
jgi:DNA helicase-2/ATP-dependent DNA helicase PcrA